jgi:hypothetical protein
MPRVLIEADRPYRVVHANAAYAKQQLLHAATTTTTTTQNGTAVMSPSNVETVVHTMFSDRAVTMYPVVCDNSQGALVRYYLVQDAGMPQLPVQMIG